MIYTKKNNTYYATPKDDQKDRIEVEVGDSKQPDFCPQLKVQRWDNEANVSIRLVHDELTPKISKQGKKIKWDGVKVAVETYALTEEEGGQEFEVILKEKPKTNVVEFSLEDKDVAYDYQPELTQKEKDGGAFRDENVIGSYTVYAKTPKTNWTGGKEYKCGKVGHIFRPKIIDSVGTEVWGVLHIENGILSVAIPQNFLDNAVYPIRHAAGLTFGYTTVGSSSWNVDAADVAIGIYSEAIVSGTIAKLTGRFADQSGTMSAKGLIVDSSGNLIANGISDATSGITTTFSWVDLTFGTTPSVTDTNSYGLFYIANSTSKIQYDNVVTGIIDNTNSYDSPENTGLTVWSGIGMSLYATYTAAAAGPSNLKTYNTNLKANTKSINTNLIANVKSLNTNV